MWSDYSLTLWCLLHDKGSWRSVDAEISFFFVFFLPSSSCRLGRCSMMQLLGLFHLLNHKHVLFLQRKSEPKRREWFFSQKKSEFLNAVWTVKGHWKTVFRRRVQDTQFLKNYQRTSGLHPQKSKGKNHPWAPHLWLLKCSCLDLMKLEEDSKRLWSTVSHLTRSFNNGTPGQTMLRKEETSPVHRRQTFITWLIFCPIRSLQQTSLV